MSHFQALETLRQYLSNRSYRDYLKAMWECCHHFVFNHLYSVSWLSKKKNPGLILGFFLHWDDALHAPNPQQSAICVCGSALCIPTMGSFCSLSKYGYPALRNHGSDAAIFRSWIGMSSHKEEFMFSRVRVNFAFYFIFCLLIYACILFRGNVRLITLLSLIPFLSLQCIETYGPLRDNARLK